MKTVLVTGFEPFGGERVNPSALVAGRRPIRVGSLASFPCFNSQDTGTVIVKRSPTPPHLSLFQRIAIWSSSLELPKPSFSLILTR